MRKFPQQKQQHQQQQQQQQQKQQHSQIGKGPTDVTTEDRKQVLVQM